MRDSGHALLWELAPRRAIEVTSTAAMTHLHDQAGLLIRVPHETWMEAGLEFTDGAAHLSTVVTRSTSDWSTAPVPGWSARLRESGPCRREGRLPAADPGPDRQTTVLGR